MERTSASTKFELGSSLPEFLLPGVDGKKYGSEYLKTGKAALVVFACNHCPYVKGSEELLIKVVREFEAKGLKSVAINSNDAVEYPEDSFDSMKAKAKALHLPYPYLFDESQEIARKFDAACTPECYLFDAGHQLAYHGTVCDNLKDTAAAKRVYLRTALDQVLSGQPADPAFVHPIGCSIKWKR